MAELGWLGIVFPEEHGGAGLGYMDQMVVLEEMGRGLMPEPFLSTVLLGATALLLGGSAAQKKAHLPAVAAGERLLDARVSGGGQPLRPAPRRDQGRRKAGGGLVALRREDPGARRPRRRRLVVARAHRAARRADAQGVTLFLVAADTPGVTIERQSRIDGRNVGARPLRRRAGRRRRGRRRRSTAAATLLARVVDRATIGLSAEMLGSMQAAFEMTNEYLKTRVQFGVADRELPGAQAPRRQDVHRARAGALGGDGRAPGARHDARASDEPTPTIAKLASLAKARCSDAFVLIGNECVQMHGGIGMTDEHDIGFFFKRARVAEMTFGDAAWHRDRTARLEGY